MQHGLTQQQLADQVGVHRRVLARLENGETTKQLRMLLELLLALGVEMRLEQARPKTTDATPGPEDGL
jgi:transcriptional regulator with XRE-family HTH domain